MQASAFASDIDAYLAYIDLERGLSRNTRESYQRDLEQCAAFAAAQGRRRLAGGHGRAGGGLGPVAQPARGRVQPGAQADGAAGCSPASWSGSACARTTSRRSSPGPGSCAGSRSPSRRPRSGRLLASPVRGRPRVAARPGPPRALLLERPARLGARRPDAPAGGPRERARPGLRQGLEGAGRAHGREGPRRPRGLDRLRPAPLRQAAHAERALPEQPRDAASRGCRSGRSSRSTRGGPGSRRP